MNPASFTNIHKWKLVQLPELIILVRRTSREAVLTINQI